MQRTLYILVFILVYAVSYSQRAEIKEDTLIITGINQYDENHKKTGLWITETDLYSGLLSQYDVTLYKNEGETFIRYTFRVEPDNIERLYLSYIYSYNEGQLAGSLYAFDYNKKEFPALEIVYMQSKFMTLPEDHEFMKLIPERFLNKEENLKICYHENFYRSGGMESCGWLLFFDNDNDSDMTWEIGEWKYFDEVGNLIKTKIEKP